MDFDASTGTGGGSFDRRLKSRPAVLPTGGEIFPVCALQDGTSSCASQQALRNRRMRRFTRLRSELRNSDISWRISSCLHDAWGQDLRGCKTGLGESHDLFVILADTQRFGVFPMPRAKSAGGLCSSGRRQRASLALPGKMVGMDSLWSIWRLAFAIAEPTGFGNPENDRKMAFFRNQSQARTPHKAPGTSDAEWPPAWKSPGN